MTAEKNEPVIVYWKDIAEQFTDGLVLGNGASIALHKGFQYESLHSAARDLGFLSPEVTEIFHKFETNDFELVLRRLWQAQLVNKALGVEVEKVDAAYQQVRGALISTVRSNHISYDVVEPYLPSIYGFMQGFKTVLSLNYDLIVYWAMMAAQPSLGSWFKDCFNASEFRENWEDMRKPYGKATGSSLVFYPHGNLILARDSTGAEIKLKLGAGSDLLSSILSKWEAGNVSPLFVSEGTSSEKVLAISSATYTHRVLREVVPKIGKSLVVYGWSISDTDEHILKHLRHASIDRVAVSVMGDDEAFRLRVKNAFSSIGIANIVFFHADSPGCWPQVAKAPI